MSVKSIVFRWWHISQVPILRSLRLPGHHAASFSRTSSLPASKSTQFSAEKWSSGEPVAAKPDNAKVIRRQNWEDYNLFGPLLKTKDQRRRELTRRTKKKKNEETSEDDKVITVICTENGYLDKGPRKREYTMTISELMAAGIDVTPFEDESTPGDGKKTDRILNDADTEELLSEECDHDPEENASEDADEKPRHSKNEKQAMIKDSRIQSTLNAETFQPKVAPGVGSWGHNLAMTLAKKPQKVTRPGKGRNWYTDKFEVIPDIEVSSESTVDTPVDFIFQKNQLLELIGEFPMSQAVGHSSQKLQEELSNMWRRAGLENHFPSVTTILQKTMPAESVITLERWKRSMIAKLGEKGFQDYQQETLSTGLSLHQNIAEYLSGREESEIQVKEANAGHWKSIREMMSQVTDVHLVEKRVRHPFLHYSGAVDCVAQHRGSLVLIEWKTSQRAKPLLQDTYDNPLQVVAYLGALNLSGSLDFQVERAIIAIAYPSGSSAHIHYLTAQKCQYYWSRWLERVKLFIDTQLATQ